MIELKYNETSQLQVRLAILESQLKVANNKIKYLEKIKKIGKGVSGRKVIYET